MLVSALILALPLRLQWQLKQKWNGVHFSTTCLMMLWIYTCKTAGFVAQHFYPQIQQDSWHGATIFLDSMNRVSTGVVGSKSTVKMIVAAIPSCA
jgi:hypothetical protein